MYTEGCVLEMCAVERYENCNVMCFKFGAIIFCFVVGIMGTPLEATSADYYRNCVSYD